MAVTHRARRLTEAHASPRHLAEVLYRIRGLRMIGHVLHVGAHPDDVEVAMGGTIAKLSDKGLTTLLVDLCDGEPTRHASREPATFKLPRPPGFWV